MSIAIGGVATLSTKIQIEDGVDKNQDDIINQKGIFALHNDKFEALFTTMR